MFPVSLSILASFLSAITILGTATEMYRFGTQYMLIILSYFIVIPSAAYLYMPVFYRLELTSAHEVSITAWSLIDDYDRKCRLNLIVIKPSHDFHLLVKQ